MQLRRLRCTPTAFSTDDFESASLHRTNEYGLEQSMAPDRLGELRQRRLIDWPACLELARSQCDNGDGSDPFGGTARQLTQKCG